MCMADTSRDTNGRTYRLDLDAKMHEVMLEIYYKSHDSGKERRACGKWVREVGTAGHSHDIEMILRNVSLTYPRKGACADLRVVRLLTDEAVLFLASNCNGCFRGVA